MQIEGQRQLSGEKGSDQTETAAEWKCSSAFLSVLNEGEIRSAAAAAWIREWVSEPEITTTCPLLQGSDSPHQRESDNDAD